MYNSNRQDRQLQRYGQRQQRHRQAPRHTTSTQQQESTKLFTRYKCVVDTLYTVAEVYYENTSEATTFISDTYQRFHKLLYNVQVNNNFDTHDGALECYEHFRNAFLQKEDRLRKIFQHRDTLPGLNPMIHLLRGVFIPTTLELRDAGQEPYEKVETLLPFVNHSNETPATPLTKRLIMIYERFYQNNKSIFSITNSQLALPLHTIKNLIHAPIKDEKILFEIIVRVLNKFFIGHSKDDTREFSREQHDALRSEDHTQKILRERHDALQKNNDQIKLLGQIIGELRQFGMKNKLDCSRLEEIRALKNKPELQTRTIASSVPQTKKQTLAAQTQQSSETTAPTKLFMRYKHSLKALWIMSEIYNKNSYGSAAFISHHYHNLYSIFFGILKDNSKLQTCKTDEECYKHLYIAINNNKKKLENVFKYDTDLPGLKVMTYYLRGAFLRTTADLKEAEREPHDKIENLYPFTLVQKTARRNTQFALAIQKLFQESYDNDISIYSRTNSILALPLHATRDIANSPFENEFILFELLTGMLHKFFFGDESENRDGMLERRQQALQNTNDQVRLLGKIIGILRTFGTQNNLDITKLDEIRQLKISSTQQTPTRKINAPSQYAARNLFLPYQQPRESASANSDLLSQIENLQKTLATLKRPLNADEQLKLDELQQQITVLREAKRATNSFTH